VTCFPGAGGARHTHEILADTITVHHRRTASQVIAGLFLPPTWLVGLAFVFFRVFDIAKPFRPAPKVGGVVGDDPPAPTQASPPGSCWFYDPQSRSSTSDAHHGRIVDTSASWIEDRLAGRSRCAGGDHPETPRGRGTGQAVVILTGIGLTADDLTNSPVSRRHARGGGVNEHRLFGARTRCRSTT
jgi:hypothetical protein